MQNRPQMTSPALSPEQVRSLTTPSPARISVADYDPGLSPSTKMLLAISATGKHLYQGTVDPEVVRRRRAANKRARHARRVSRR